MSCMAKLAIGKVQLLFLERFVALRCGRSTLHIGPLLLQDREKPGHKIEVDEEYEDAEGNVYNRKTYEDLRRQGLI